MTGSVQWLDFCGVLELLQRAQVRAAAERGFFRRYQAAQRAKALRDALDVVASCRFAVEDEHHWVLVVDRWLDQVVAQLPHEDREEAEARAARLNEQNVAAMSRDLDGEVV